MTGVDGAPKPGPDIIAAFTSAVADTGRHRLNRRTVWQLWNHADPAWAGSWAARLRLADTLTTLADVGTITLPAPAGKRWDHALPPLPDHLDVPANRPTAKAQRLDPANEPWGPQLMGWAPTWIRTNHPPRQLCLDAVLINRWLLGTTGHPAPPVAREERSLHLFDDEKHLAHLTAGPLFMPGRLRLNDLTCTAPIGHLRCARLRPTGPILVVENKSTFDSAWRTQRAASHPTYAAVLFGSGDAVTNLAADLLHLDDLIGVQPTTIDYAGDVDTAGIDAAAHFTRAAADVGLTVRMATALWDAVAASTPTGEDTTAAPDRTTLAVNTAHRLGLPDTVLTRLRERVRVPQERVDRTALTDLGWWAPTPDP